MERGIQTDFRPAQEDQMRRTAFRWSQFRGGTIVVGKKGAVAEIERLGVLGGIGRVHLAVKLLAELDDGSQRGSSQFLAQCGELILRDALEFRGIEGTEVEEGAPQPG